MDRLALFCGLVGGADCDDDEETNEEEGEDDGECFNHRCYFKRRPIVSQFIKV